jgi:Zn-dependent peptidase ImmA (M78 family)/transcriptional regulator with XRE-family HTH domain
MPRQSKVNLNNPKILTWAREEMAINISEVASRFNKTEKIIKGWEAGTDSPTFAQLTELANYYKRPIAVFFLPAIPPKSPKPTDFRTLPGISEGQFNKYTLLAYRELQNMLMETYELISALDLKISFSLPAWTTDDNPEQKAEQLRSLFGVSVDEQIKTFVTYYHAQDVWRSVLFDHGVVVRICRMPIDDARAFCLFGNGLAGIGLSSEDREHGRIFSLFHEVCHLGLRQPGVSGKVSNNASSNQELEQYCDRFAAAFLLPASNPDVIRSLEDFRSSMTLETARAIANKFKVSKYVVARRALDLVQIDKAIYWKMIENWLTQDALHSGKQETDRIGGGNYHATQISYVGERFIQLVIRALQSNYLTPVEVRRIVGLDHSVLEMNL